MIELLTALWLFYGTGIAAYTVMKPSPEIYPNTELKRYPRGEE